MEVSVFFRSESFDDSAGTMATSENQSLISGRDHHGTNRFALFQLLMSATTQAVMAVCARSAALNGMSSGAILFIRGITTMLFTSIALFSSRLWSTKLSREDFGRIILRACVTTASLYLQFSALHALQVGSVVSLLYTAAAWTLILMVILEKSPFTRTHVVVILIKAVGATLVIERAPIAAFEAVVAAALSAIAAVLLAGRSERISPPHASFAVGISALISGFFIRNENIIDLIHTHHGIFAVISAFGSAIAGVISQLLLISAAPTVPTSTAVVTRSLGVPFTFVFAMLVLQEPVRISSMIGATCIVVAVALSAFKLHCETMLMDEGT